jgi:hypothetical protein
MERIERTSGFAKNLCNSLAFRMAAFDTPETLYQECALEVERFYQDRLQQEAPPEFMDFLARLFGAAAATVAVAGPRAGVTNLPPDTVAVADAPGADRN